MHTATRAEVRRGSAAAKLRTVQLSRQFDAQAGKHTRSTRARTIIVLGSCAEHLLEIPHTLRRQGGKRTGQANVLGNGGREGEQARSRNYCCKSAVMRVS